MRNPVTNKPQVGLQCAIHGQYWVDIDEYERIAKYATPTLHARPSCPSCVNAELQAAVTRALDRVADGRELMTKAPGGDEHAE